MKGKIMTENTFTVKISPVNIDFYKAFVQSYNSLPESQREEWSGENIRPPFDEPVLYSRTFDYGDSEEYVLQVIPEWASSADSIQSCGSADADDFYEVKPKNLYKQDLKLIVFYYNSKMHDSDTLTYEEFLICMKHESNSVYSKFTETTKAPVFTIADAIKKLESIPEEQRNLPLYVFDWYNNNCYQATGASPFERDTNISIINPFQIDFNSSPDVGVKYGLNLQMVLNQAPFSDMSHSDYYKALSDLLVISDELSSEIADFNNMYDKKAPKLETDGLNLVYFNIEKIKEPSLSKLNDLISKFFAQALWSEYSAQFDGEEDYKIKEDDFIDHATDFLDKELIGYFN